MEQLRVIVEEQCRGNATEAASQAIIKHLFQFTSGAEQHDDITFLILSLQSPEPSSIMASTKIGGNK
jgi:serine phosphatase RsbU (regulator of sigma subunit)